MGIWSEQGCDLGLRVKGMWVMRRRLRWQDLLPLGIAAAFAAYGIYLLVVGPLLVTVARGVPGSVTTHNPTIAGLFPLAAGSLVVFGIWAGRDRLAWGGGALALLFSVAFLFSMGGTFIPVAVLLLVCLAIRNLSSRQRTKRE
jgi:hypothetical protein